MAKKKVIRSVAKAGGPRRTVYEPTPNDFLSGAFDALGMIPEKFRGTDQFLDVVTWNLRYFHPREKDRVDRISSLLSVLNADVIVLQEVADGSLTDVVTALEANGAGYYSAAYGTTGGDQRVAFLWDLDWIRSKDTVDELFGRGSVIAGDGKDAFPRLPLRGQFTALPQEPGRDPFEFQLVGLHLKSQMGDGTPQRMAAADALAAWLRSTAPRTDGDVVMLGDYNKEPGAPEWNAFRALENAGLADFEAINDSSEFSHLYYKNKSHLGSRLDLVLMSSSAKLYKNADPGIVLWTPLKEFIETQPTAAALKQALAAVRSTISDHLPVVTRFYFSRDPGALRPTPPALPGTRRRRR